MATNNGLSTSEVITKNALLVCLVVVVTVGVLGSIFAKENTVQVIGFCSMISVSLLTMIQAKRAEAKSDIVAEKVEQVAAKAKEVQTVLATTTSEHAKKLDGVVSDVKEVKVDIAEVKHATNGMKKQLEDAAFAAGVKVGENKP